jgi:hypothetical protein
MHFFVVLFQHIFFWRYNRIFVKKDHPPQFIDKKDHLWVELTKRTTSGVAAEPPGDTWRMPPGGVAAGTRRPSSWRHVSRAPRRQAAVRPGGPCRRCTGRQACVAYAAPRGGGRPRAGIRPADRAWYWLRLKLTKETALIPRRLETNCVDFYVTLLIVMIPARESLQRFYQWMHCSVQKLDWDL